MNRCGIDHQMGLRMPIYWLVNYFWCYLLYCFVAAFLIIAGLVFRTCPRPTTLDASHTSPSSPWHDMSCRA